jgi:hypothetical protein
MDDFQKLVSVNIYLKNKCKVLQKKIHMANPGMLIICSTFMLPKPISASCIRIYKPVNFILLV